MPQLSIIIPAYNNSRYLPECIRSLTMQDYRDIEIIVVDDASTDDTSSVVKDLAEDDSRIRLFQHKKNAGTLASRKSGILASHGSYVMLIDQDDALAPNALTSLMLFAQQHPADIYHFGVKVHAANSQAQQAAAGMTSFLTPTPRTLQGEDILQYQFASSKGFDWHVHHKMYSGDFARNAYTLASDTRLVLSDDLYMSFILCSTASTYIAIPDSPWYIYHLGRGDTLGQQLTPKTSETIAQRDAQALSLLKKFVSQESSKIKRSDWDDRLADVRNRLIEHTMNEWKDNLPSENQKKTLQRILQYWEPDTVCGEIYRYVRDYAYAYLTAKDHKSQKTLYDKANAKTYLDMARYIEKNNGLPGSSKNNHYLGLREIAYTHLYDSGLLARPQSQPHGLRALLSTFLTRL